MAFLELKSVSKSYGATPVLHDINLSIEKGEFVAIVGYSGAGKTTFISLIAGLLKPDSGTLRIGVKRLAGTDGRGRRAKAHVDHPGEEIDRHLRAGVDVGDRANAHDDALRRRPRRAEDTDGQD